MKYYTNVVRSVSIFLVSVFLTAINYFVCNPLICNCLCEYIFFRAYICVCIGGSNAVTFYQAKNLHIII